MTEDKTHGALTCNEFELRASQAMGQLYLQGHVALVERDAAREEFLDAVAWLESLGAVSMSPLHLATLLRCGDHVGAAKKKGAAGVHAPEPATGNGMHDVGELPDDGIALAPDSTKARVYGFPTDEEQGLGEPAKRAAADPEQQHIRALATAAAENARLQGVIADRERLLASACKERDSCRAALADLLAALKIVDDAWDGDALDVDAHEAACVRRESAREVLPDWAMTDSYGWVYQGERGCHYGHCWHRGPWHVFPQNEITAPHDASRVHFAERDADGDRHVARNREAAQAHADAEIARERGAR